MLHRLTINGLFNITGNNKVINFNKDITILVGKNGSGKTTVLNILNAILTKTFTELLEYNFENIILESDEGNLLINSTNECIDIFRTDVDNVIKDVTLSNDQLESFNKKSPLVYMNIPRENVLESRRSSKKQFTFNVNSLYLPTYRRIEEDLFKLLIDNQQTKNRIPRFVLEESFYLIDEETRTILGFSNRDIKNTIARKWSQISEKEKQCLNALIGNFFFSLIDPFSSSERININDDKMSEELLEFFKMTGYVKQDKQLKDKIDTYIKNILWSKNAVKNLTSLNKDELTKWAAIQQSQSTVNVLLQMYDKAREELEYINAPFKKFTEKLSMFIDKKISIKEGQLIFSLKNKDLTFEDLSAGEKQLVTLFVYTQISLSKGTIILIDEPELSLHVSWQRKFLNALVSDDTPLQYVISTHSPFIISNYEHKMEYLGPMEDDENDGE